MWRLTRRFLAVAILFGGFCWTVAAQERALDQVAPAAPNANRSRLLRDMTLAKTGKDLGACLEALAWEVASDSLADAPSPNSAALTELTLSLLPPGAPSPPKASKMGAATWQNQMAKTLTIALGQTLSDVQERKVVSLLPLFVSGDKVARAVDVQALRRALAVDVAMAARPDASEEVLYRRGLKGWAGAAWRRADETQKNDYVKAALDATRQAGGAVASAALVRWSAMVPLAQWLARHPDELDRFLGDPDPKFRQQALALALRARPRPRLEVKRPATRAALIEALCADDVPDNADPAARQLTLAGRSLVPALRKAFLASADWQQAIRLVALLAPYGNPAVQQEIAQFSCDLLDPQSARAVRFVNDATWPGVQGQARWAEAMLRRVGDVARRQLASRLLESRDDGLTREMARILKSMGGLDASALAPEFMRRMASGFMPNAPAGAQRSSTLVLSLVRPEARKGALKALRALAVNPDGTGPLSDDSVTAAQTKIPIAGNAGATAKPSTNGATATPADLLATPFAAADVTSVAKPSAPKTKRAAPVAKPKHDADKTSVTKAVSPKKMAIKASKAKTITTATTETFSPPVKH